MTRTRATAPACCRSSCGIEEGPQIAAANVAAFRAGWNFGETTETFVVSYEIKPAPGVRVEKISNLSNNIAMNLEAEAVRILAPVPGKGTVGIEIPNRNRKDVLLREIIESKAWAEAAMELPVVLGVDSVTNKPVIQDLAKMPHALIAGATGQGKSVCINAIIVSLLYRCTPQDLRFIMVDPKVVELQIYNNLPHLLIPVETDPKRVPAALKWLIAEMSQRYKIFAKCGVKNITGFNANQFNLVNGFANNFGFTGNFIGIACQDLAGTRKAARSAQISCQGASISASSANTASSTTLAPSPGSGPVGCNSPRARRGAISASSGSGLNRALRPSSWRTSPGRQAIQV